MSVKVLEPEETQHIILPPTLSPQAQVVTNEKSKIRETATCPKPEKDSISFGQAPPDIGMLNKQSSPTYLEEKPL